MKKPVDNICGWELSNPDMELFDSGVLEVFGACKDCEFNGECLTPCEAMRCLMPKNGELFHLGHEQEPDGVKLSYYALINEGKVRFIQLSEPDHYWAKARCIDEEQVPNWALSNISE